MRYAGLQREAFSVADENRPERERNEVLRREVLVRGVVQGVGFRPFVYRLALEEGLAGFVGNGTDGVSIEIEGPRERVEAFLRRLSAEPPPLARIDSVKVRELAAMNAIGFQIIASDATGRVSTGIPADAATCPDCLRELFDPQDHRFLYPFLNCTNCGPRFTITRQIPYDRPQTSMAKFPMCPECQREYDDPANRRFHAQPNACWVCGPQVWLVEADALGMKINSANLPTRDFRAAEANLRPLSKPFSTAPTTSSNAKDTATSTQDDPVLQTINLLLAGRILAIKGIGGFHLSVDATNQAAVMRLRERKHRYGKPLAVMVRDLEAARAICVLTAEEETLMMTSARPIVLARKRNGSGIAESVAPGIPWLGVFLPYAPLQTLALCGRARAGAGDDLCQSQRRADCHRQR